MKELIARSVTLLCYNDHVLYALGQTWSILDGTAIHSVHAQTSECTKRRGRCTEI